MKTASPALTALIQSNNFAQWNCYTITLSSGLVLYLSGANFPISFGGTTWLSNGVMVDQNGSTATCHAKVGTDTDTWNFTVMPRSADPATGNAYPDMIGSFPWLQAARSGVFNNADILVQRAYFAGPPVNPIPLSGATPVGMLTCFHGLAGPIAIGSTSATITVNDYKSLLNLQMPRNPYQSSCRHTLFDVGCSLNRAAFAVNGVALAGGTNVLVLATIGAPAGSGTYNLGQIAATTGANAGFARSVKSWDGGSTFNMLAPFPYPFAAGDQITALPGCLRSLASCAEFANTANYGGEPYIPPPSVTLSG